MGHSMNLGQSSGKSGVVVIFEEGSFEEGRMDFQEGTKISSLKTLLAKITHLRVVVSVQYKYKA
jgi:hypothetical protein